MLIQSALEAFITWLETHFTGQKPILVAHNGKSFDSRVLLNNLHLRADETLRKRFYDLEIQFGDSLHLFKQAYPRLSKHALPIVYQHAFGKSYRNSHQATTDVARLAEILVRPESAGVDFSKFVFAAEVSLVLFSIFSLESVDCGCKFHLKMLSYIFSGTGPRAWTLDLSRSSTLQDQHGPCDKSFVN